MNALQLLPLLSFYVFKNTKATIIISLLYAILAITTLVQALNGKPIFTQNEKKDSEYKTFYSNVLKKTFFIKMEAYSNSF
jgi:hypothetical protein